MSTAKIYSLRYGDARAWLAAAIFAAGNIALPQLFHLAHQGGPTWLPIYFFTLVGAYKYGWRVGALIAVASPVVNHLLFGMPSDAVLPLVIVRSALLVAVAALAAHRFRNVSLPLLAGVVAVGHAAGLLAAWAVTGNFGTALDALLTGTPGMALQIVGGWLLLRYALNKL